METSAGPGAPTAVADLRVSATIGHVACGAQNLSAYRAEVNALTSQSSALAYLTPRPRRLTRVLQDG